MPKPGRKLRQNSQYDKIIRENLETTLPMIIKEVLGLNIQGTEELPDDVQHTKERRPDALKKVTDAAGNSYVLQVEFQVEDEKEMVLRMAEYYIMLCRRYHLPVKQYVIFLQDKYPQMETVIQNEDLSFKFNLVRIADINYQLFLSSGNPETMLLGILADFGKEDVKTVINSIFEGVRSNTIGDLKKSQNFNKLRILVQLRNNVKSELDIIMQLVSVFFKEENEFLYRKGEIKGRKQTLHAIVANLLAEPGISDEQAARIAEVSVRYVGRVRAQMAKIAR